MILHTTCEICGGSGEDPSTQENTGCVHLVCADCGGVGIVPVEDA